MPNRKPEDGISDMLLRELKSLTAKLKKSSTSHSASAVFSELVTALEKNHSTHSLDWKDVLAVLNSNPALKAKLLKTEDAAEVYNHTAELLQQTESLSVPDKVHTHHHDSQQVLLDLMERLILESTHPDDPSHERTAAVIRKFIEDLKNIKHVDNKDNNSENPSNKLNY